MRNHDLYARLELIPRDRVIATHLLKNKLASLGKSLVNFLTGSMQLRITEKRDRAGNLHFRVYDPYDRSHRTFNSETGLREWLEQRYYQ